jgi:hypothetical protein
MLTSSEAKSEKPAASKRGAYYTMASPSPPCYSAMCSPNKSASRAPALSFLAKSHLPSATRRRTHQHVLNKALVRWINSQNSARLCNKVPLHHASQR